MGKDGETTPAQRNSTSSNAPLLGTIETVHQPQTLMANSANPRRSNRYKWRVPCSSLRKTCALLMATMPFALAQTETCVSLSGSSTCSAFNASSISTDSYMVGVFPFLQGVTDVASFDRNLQLYVGATYDTTKYGTLLGCNTAALQNTSSLYARYTSTVICNAVVQNSISRCGLTAASSRPMCASDCTSFAESEANIVANSNLCINPTMSTATQNSQIRADFTNCALPAAALDLSQCITGVTNEPTNCGFSTNTLGLCSYCGSGSANSTDTCCYNSRAEQRCAGVVLPSIVASITLTTSTPLATSSPTSSPSSTSSSSASAADGNAGGDGGLSGGAIAGIVIGSVVGAALLVGLLFLLCLCIRRRQRPDSAEGALFNQPSPAQRSTPPMGQTAVQGTPAGYEVLPGGRIARMSALEGHSGDSPPVRDRVAVAGAGVVGAGALSAYEAQHARHDTSSSDGYGPSPVSEQYGGVLRPPPPTGRRTGSLSSNSMLGFGEVPESPEGSPDAFSSQQSEQLSVFKDYYSQDEIHLGDKVATLWAYQPRAADEFALERGDMLKVVGIWDDGWATGVLVDETAEQWEVRRAAQRDSGVSNGGQRAYSPMATTGKTKAFPLVCVCLPQHWSKMIDGDSATEGSGRPR